MIGIAKNIHWIDSLLHFLDLPCKHLAVHHHAAIRPRQPFARAVENRPLSFPRHEILGIDFIKAELGEWMARADWIFERLAVMDRHLAVGWTRFGGIRHEVNVNDIGESGVDRHAELRAGGLPQHGWKEQRMLFNLAISEIAPLDYAVGELFHFILDQVVDGAARRTRDFESVGDQLLMKHMQMRRIDGVFHRLQPVAVELWQRAPPVPAVGARPDIIFWYRRRGLRPKIRPVKPRQLLDRISFVLYSPAKIAPRRLCRRLRAVA